MYSGYKKKKNYERGDEFRPNDKSTSTDSLEAVKGANFRYKHPCYHHSHHNKNSYYAAPPLVSAPYKNYAPPPPPVYYGASSSSHNYYEPLPPVYYQSPPPSKNYSNLSRKSSYNHKLKGPMENWQEELLNSEPSQSLLNRIQRQTQANDFIGAGVPRHSRNLPRYYYADSSESNLNRIQRQTQANLYFANNALERAQQSIDLIGAGVPRRSRNSPRYYDDSSSSSDSFGEIQKISNKTREPANINFHNPVVSTSNSHEEQAKFNPYY